MTAFLSQNGFVIVAKKSDGTFTGTLKLQGKSLPLKGDKFTPTGNATVSVAGNTTVSATLPGKIPVKVDLAYVPSPAPGIITGNVTVNGGTPRAFTALPNFTGKKQPAKHDLCGKKYTVVLPSDPGSNVGHGYATLSFAADGTAKFVGKLSDGTPFTSTARTGNGTVSDANDPNWVVPVVVPLYPKMGGLLFGEIRVPQTPQGASADVVGSLGWLRPTITKGKTVTDGFLKSTEPVGTSFDLVKDTNFLSGGQADAQFILNAAGQVLPGTWPLKNNPSLTKPCTISLVPASGIIKGKVVTTLNDKKVTTPFEGVVLSKPLTLPNGAIPVRGAGFSPNAVGSDAAELTVP